MPIDLDGWLFVESIVDSKQISIDHSTSPGVSTRNENRLVASKKETWQSNDCQVVSGIFHFT